MEDDYTNRSHNNNTQKKDMLKQIGPKLSKNKQCKKQSQNNTTIQLLASQKIHQEELQKEKKLEKTLKVLTISTNENILSCQSRIQEEVCDIAYQDEICFEETKEHDMEDEPEEDLFLRQGEESKEAYRDRQQRYNSVYGSYEDYNILHFEISLALNLKLWYLNCQPKDTIKQRFGYSRLQIGYFEQFKNAFIIHSYLLLNFKHCLNDSILFTQKVDVSNCLKNHKIPSILRAKMVDWMIEVFANYRQTSSDKTYFRAVCLLDLFYKKYTKTLTEGDVHLFGIAAMFLATKQEDISHISLDDIVEKVGHKKFKEKKIREAEYEILNAVDMNTDFPTPYTYLNRYIYKIFSSSINQVIAELTQFSVYILKQCLHDEKLFEFSSHILAFSAIVTSIKIYFRTLRGEIENSQSEQLQTQEVIIMEQMFGLIKQQEHQVAKDCYTHVKDNFFQFSTKFPELKNLDKFAN